MIPDYAYPVGENNKKALFWVQSHEDLAEAEIAWDAWAGYFIEVSQGLYTSKQFEALSTRCFDLFDTPMWAIEWRAA